MVDNQQTATTIWIGRAFSSLVVIILLVDAAVNLFAPDILKADMAAAGFPVELAPVLGAVMLVCAAIYASSRTAVLGAILVTGFCGGAICLHLRVGEIGSPPQIICILIGVLAWAGLFLRDAGVRALMPLRHQT